MHLAILDFEANCLEHTVIKPQEIIEVPIVVVNCDTCQIVPQCQFHEYCRPNLPVTPFCTALTGITQATVDAAASLPDVLGRLQDWYERHEWTRETLVVVTCGEWDLATALPSHARHLGIKVPGWLKEWVNIKRVFTALTGQRCGSMLAMLAALGLKLEGRHHSGIDDAHNIARCACALHALALRQGKPDIWTDLRHWVPKPKKQQINFKLHVKPKV